MPTLSYWGLKSNPYTTTPISEETLNLFVGREKEIKLCQSTLKSKAIIVIEGGRGVGTTSFGNVVRFNLKKKRGNFTPESEISTGPGWNREVFLANVLSNLVWSLEKEEPKLGKNKRFIEIKRVTHQVRETFKNVSVQLNILGTGGGMGYGKQAMVTTPPLYPVTTLTQCLKEITKIIKEIVYEKETLIQINNLDIETMIDPGQLIFLLNDIRDPLQLEGYGWLLVGDRGLRNFISSQVDRLDDIVSMEVCIEALSLEEVFKAIKKRLEVFSINKKAISPITDNLIEALYTASRGRLRQIFGVATRLLNLTEENNLIERIDLDVAIPLLKREVEDRIRQNNIPPTAEKILKHLVKIKSATPSVLSKKARMPISNISRALKQLRKARLVSCQQKGKERIYIPLTDVTIALK